jgi:hypothetical protein
MSDTPEQLGEPDHMKRVSWEYVDLEEEDVELVSFSERCSSGGGGGCGTLSSVSQSAATAVNEAATNH